MSFDYLPDNKFTLALQVCFFASFIPHMIVYVFSIFNNLEEIGFVKKLLLNEGGNVIVKKLILLRFLVCIIVLCPLFFIKDAFFYIIILGCILCPIIGVIWPVS